jgi:predicted nucleic acid-binding protein
MTAGERFFLDTNVLVYSFDDRSRSKQNRACDLVEQALTTHRGIISYQVVQEFLNVAMGKFAGILPIAEAQIYLARVLMPLCEVFPSPALFAQALTISSESKVSFYDALIVASAVAGDCRILWTEDLQHGRRFASLEIRNPFKSDGN